MDNWDKHKALLIKAAKQATHTEEWFKWFRSLKKAPHSRATRAKKSRTPHELKWHRAKQTWVCSKCGHSTKSSDISKKKCSQHREVWKQVHPTHAIFRTFEEHTGTPVI